MFLVPVAAEFGCCCWTSGGSWGTTAPRRTCCAPQSACCHSSPAARCRGGHREGPGPDHETCSPPGPRIRSTGSGRDTAWTQTPCSGEEAAEASHGASCSRWQAFLVQIRVSSFLLKGTDDLLYFPTHVETKRTRFNCTMLMSFQ